MPDVRVPEHLMPAVHEALARNGFTLERVVKGDGTRLVLRETPALISVPPPFVLLPTD